MAAILQSSLKAGFARAPRPQRVGAEAHLNLPCTVGTPVQSPKATC